MAEQNEGKPTSKRKITTAFIILRIGTGCADILIALGLLILALCPWFAITLFPWSVAAVLTALGMLLRLRLWPLANKRLHRSTLAAAATVSILSILAIVSGCIRHWTRDESRLQIVSTGSIWRMLDVIPEADIASLGVRLCGMLHFLPTTQAREVRALLKDEYRLMERDKGMANAGNVALISLIHKGGGPTLVLRPRNEGEKPSGTLLFLHGAGAPMMMYPWLLAGLADRENLIVVCPSWRGGEWSESGAAEHALEQLRAVMSAQNTDAQRTYLGGISMGGAGGWRVLDADARVFRGFICISGYGMPATDISIPIFMVEGGQDSVAATEAELRRVNSLSRLVLLPNDDHFVFLRSRKQVTDAVCDWMDLIEE